MWEWAVSDHFDELGFDEDAKLALSRDPNTRGFGAHAGDWMHINSASVLGPNRFYDAETNAFIPII